LRRSTGTPKAIIWHPPRKPRFKKKASHGICGGYFRSEQGEIFEGKQALVVPNKFMENEQGDLFLTGKRLCILFI